MLAEIRLAKRFLGAMFGYGEPLLDGTYAIPTTMYNTPAFMSLKVNNGVMGGIKFYWDEKLTMDCHKTPKPNDTPKESNFAKAFRKLEKANI